MKKNIHPDYHQTKIACACGAVLEVGSTQENMEIEICSQCHPYFTGDKKVVDTAGRVERFKQLTAKSEAKKKIADKAKQAKAKKEKIIKDTEKKESKKTSTKKTVEK